MPLFLPFDLHKKWLEEETSSTDYQAILDFEMLPVAMEAWSVLVSGLPRCVLTIKPRMNYTNEKISQLER